MTSTESSNIMTGDQRAPTPGPFYGIAQKIGWQHDEIARLNRCITMAMGCLDPESSNPDERLAWLRLSDGMNGKEPRATL